MARSTVRTDRYTRVAIAFHWIIAAAILFNLWLGLANDSLPKDWKVMPVHKAMGITILVLAIARLAWRLTHRPPSLPVTAPPWERLAAAGAHWGLYALTILIPLTGWMMVSGTATRRPLDWFGLFPLPYLPVSEGLGGFGHDAHELLAFAMIALILLHVAAALRHHFLLRDDTLVRMLPIVRAPRR
ncbi:cytochrome b [Sphingomonas sp. RS2018]